MLIVGLGNPGKEYENTFHNMGYMALDAIASKLNRKVERAECSSLTAVASSGGERIILAKPLTYMNGSGSAVKSLMSKYNQTAEELVVIYDDIDIPRFSVRARANGGAGTHNGMRDVVDKVGSENFKRIRIGIGKNEFDLKDYVLGKIDPHDLAVFQEKFALLSDLVACFVRDGDFERLMREANVIK